MCCTMTLLGRQEQAVAQRSSRFAGTVTLVAGGTGALGSAVSRAFLDEDATVIVTYRRQEEFEGLAQAAAEHRSRLEGHRIDATDEAATLRLVDDIVARHRRLDVLVNTVGGYAGGGKLWELDTEVLDRMLALNLRSGYALARAVVPTMLRQAGGSIVNVAAKAALDRPAGAAAYAASKAAALALFDTLAAEVADSGVRVNSVLPRMIDTAANRDAMPQADFSKWPRPEAIARVILFLCSHDACVIHGAAIPVYGSTTK
jgi:NAD(P)-dependent dehydrogenase (short-subunit alcohol dehydrogenase family)